MGGHQECFWKKAGTLVLKVILLEQEASPSTQWGERMNNWPKHPMGVGMEDVWKITHVQPSGVVKHGSDIFKNHRTKSRE
jgi:hypothetical protein